MGTIFVLLIGKLNLFYPLLISSGILFLFAIAKKSWVSMLISGCLLLPISWYLSLDATTSWAKLIPMLPVMLTVHFFYKKEIKSFEINL
ncbi:hypothetical protein [Pseudalkalibacillus caeni]|uniref:Glycosyltransferase RgtA/B/C/D-like domain-containing protein n=1 Tax=Exobacillus caeni TaxID=2574798 RepID=A0A5R9F0S3_9BACL|nr:hypothetical protein [Pseudalkalibacillus caeni]TLS35028.1 hypothetical protein FCL54_22475 [Pseudalkalibacillus caeni]